MNTLESIRAMCANAWKTTPEEMSTACRKVNVVDAKQAETWLLSQIMGMKSSNIFRGINEGRHRSTYRYRRIAAQNKYDTDRHFRVLVELIKSHITSTSSCPQ